MFLELKFILYTNFSLYWIIRNLIHQFSFLRSTNNRGKFLQIVNFHHYNYAYYCKINIHCTFYLSFSPYFNLKVQRNKANTSWNILINYPDVYRMHKTLHSTSFNLHNIIVEYCRFLHIFASSSLAVSKLSKWWVFHHLFRFIWKFQAGIPKAQRWKVCCNIAI